MHVCARTCVRKRLTHLFVRIFLEAHFPDLHIVVIFFVALSSCAELFFWGIIVFVFVFFFIPQLFFLLMMRQIKQSATKQEMNKLDKSNHINKSSNVYTVHQKRQMKTMCSKLDIELTICNKLSNKTNHVICVTNNKSTN